MPIKIKSELRFPMGDPIPLSVDAVQDFLSLAKKITSTISRKEIIETFKEDFCLASGENYSSSSTLSWAEADLDRDAHNASSDAPGFIAAFCNACEDLGSRDIAVPNHSIINNILEKHNVPFRIINDELCNTTEYIEPPKPEESQESIVARALSDAKALIGNGNASSAIDRTHTALNGYLTHLCVKNRIEIKKNITTAKAFKLLRQRHPALVPDGPRAPDITRVLQSFATSIDAFSTIRNKASLAHANELLDEPEATAMLNAMNTIFRYIQDCIHRYKHKTA